MTAAYDVVQPFTAEAAISGRERRFQVGEVVLCETGQKVDRVIIEFESSLFSVENSVFVTCCKWKNSGA